MVAIEVQLKSPGDFHRSPLWKRGARGDFFRSSWIAEQKKFPLNPPLPKGEVIQPAPIQLLGSILKGRRRLLSPFKGGISTWSSHPSLEMRAGRFLGGVTETD
jgi:hypothetical protein